MLTNKLMRDACLVVDGVIKRGTHTSDDIFIDTSIEDADIEIPTFSDKEDFIIDVLFHH